MQAASGLYIILNAKTNAGEHCITVTGVLSYHYWNISEVFKKKGLNVAIIRIYLGCLLTS